MTTIRAAVSLALVFSIAGCAFDSAGEDGVEDRVASGEAATSATFAHPGVLLSKGQLDIVKEKIAANDEPWASQFAAMKASGFGKTSYAPAPRATIECGPSDVPNNGCTEEVNDAHAAVVQALLGYYTGTTTYVDNAIKILNAYAATVKSHTNSNAPLQAAWAAENFTRAAEIVRYTSTRWKSADVAKFSTLLKNVYLPLVKNGWAYGNGNWDLSMIDATLSIAVFLDDHTTYASAVDKWKARVPAYIYLKSDGALPVRPSETSAYASADKLLALWIWPTTGSGASAKPKYAMPDGLVQETCRDFNHVSLGLVSMIDAAATARIQGDDLYEFEDDGERISKAIELHSKYLNGATIPSTLCGGESAYRAKVGFYGKAPYAAASNYEVAYNHYANSEGLSLPETAKAIATLNESANARSKINQNAVWENLTNAAK